ncbi:MAG: COG2426 family protein [Bulleidia sp.]|mgnify:CR=1 FL=1
MQGFLEWWYSGVGQHISRELSVMLVSMIPLIEERGGLILAGPGFFQLPIVQGVFWAVIGNIIPIPFVLLFIKKILHWMAAHHLHSMVHVLEQKAYKNRDKIEKYGFWGLVLFVGIPLPGTGAWSGSLIAALLDMDLKRASLSILLGVFMAAVIMTFLSYGVIGSFVG